MSRLTREMAAAAGCARKEWLVLRRYPGNIAVLVGMAVLAPAAYVAQAFGFAGESVAGENTADAGVAIGEGEQQFKDFFTAAESGLLFGFDQRDAAENGLFDEFDQTFEHFRFAGEMAIQRRFRDTDGFGETGGGDAFARTGLQHMC